MGRFVKDGSDSKQIAIFRDLTISNVQLVDKQVKIRTTFRRFPGISRSDMRHHFVGRACMAKPVRVQFKGVRIGLYSRLDSSFFALLGCNLYESSLFAHIQMVSPLAGRLCVR